MKKTIIITLVAVISVIALIAFFTGDSVVSPFNYAVR